jgi:hypothetical protein
MRVFVNFTIGCSPHPGEQTFNLTVALERSLSVASG